MVKDSTDEFKYLVIRKTDGLANSALESDHKYFYKKPNAGVNHYQVKQVDYDGQYGYSNLATVSYRPQEISIYPNPIMGLIYLSLLKTDQVTIYSTVSRELDRFAGSHELDLKSMAKDC